MTQVNLRPPTVTDILENQNSIELEEESIWPVSNTRAPIGANKSL